MANIIDSFFIALGIKVDPSGLEKAKDAAKDARESILSMGTALTGLVAGLALHKVAEIGSTFEQNTNQIAGFLSALSLSSDFNAGLGDASKIMQKITADAARLPGEAEDYIDVFKSNAAFLKTGLPGSNANQIADWTNRLTAVAKSVASNLDSAQIAREAGQLLAVEGRAGGHNVLWQKLLPFLMQVEGQSKITATAFNAMAQPERVKLLGQAFDKLQPLLDKSATSFDAMAGAFKSNVTQLVRLGTADLFEGMKNDLNDLNNTFFDTNGNLTDTGKEVVRLIASLSRAVATLLRDGKDVVIWLADASKHTDMFKVALGGLLVLVAGSAWTKMAASVVKFASGLRVATIATGLLVVGLGLLIEDVWGFYNGADSVTGLLIDKLGPGLEIMIGLISVFTLMLSPALFLLGFMAVAVYEVYTHWQELLDFVEGGLNGWVNVLNEVIDAMNVVNKLLGADEAHMNKHFEGFSFATRHRDEANAADVLGPGGGVLAGQMGQLSPMAAGAYGPGAPMASSWLYQGANPGGAGGGMTNNTYGPVSVTVTESKDAKATGREVQRAIRTAQTRKKS